MDEVDPYRLLGVARGASAADVHDAYRRLARRLHPDAGAVDDVEMARLNEAWRTLRDPSLRAAYDRAHPTADEPPTEVDSPLLHYAETVSGASSRRRIRIAVVMLVLVVSVVFIAIFLVGFGRLGVSQTP